MPARPAGDPDRPGPCGPTSARLGTAGRAASNLLGHDGALRQDRPGLVPPGPSPRRQPGMGRGHVERNVRRPAVRHRPSTVRRGRSVPPAPAAGHPPGPRLLAGRSSAAGSWSASATRHASVPETVAKLGVDTVYWNADVTPFAVGPRRRGVRAASTVADRDVLGIAGAPARVGADRQGHAVQGVHAVLQGVEGAPVGPVARARRRHAVRRPGRAHADARRPGPHVRGRIRGQGAPRAVPRAGRPVRRRPGPTRPSTAPRCSPPTCGSAPCRPAPSPTPSARTTAGRSMFVRQLAWRDWYAHLLAELPRSAQAVDARALRPDRVAQRPGRGRGMEGRATPVSRSSTPACASCARPGGCTTGSA